MELKVGDRIYEESYGKVVGIHTVERVTKTMAICERGIRFKLEYVKPDWINKIDKARWANESYSLETEQLKEKVFRRKFASKITKIDYDSFPTEKMMKILEILKD